jgi:predicted DNA-binding transcriptional regulator AlpA
MQVAKRLNAVGIVTPLHKPKEEKKPSTSPNTSPVMHGFDAMADSAFIRLPQLVCKPKHPKNMALLPFSAATLWRKVKEGAFPQPLKLSARVTAWRVGDVRAWLQQQTGGKA